MHNYVAMYICTYACLYTFVNPAALIMRVIELCVQLILYISINMSYKFASLLDNVLFTFYIMLYCRNLAIMNPI